MKNLFILIFTAFAGSVLAQFDHPHSHYLTDPDAAERQHARHRRIGVAADDLLDGSENLRTDHHRIN